MSVHAAQWHEFADAGAWAAAAASAVADALHAALARSGAASLAVSGGTTPVPVFETLAAYPLDWARVAIGLVDERWVPPDDAASNGRLVREHLLRGPAAAAAFQPLARDDGDRARAVIEANAWFPAPTVLLFGMGDDGHTASLFPGMAGLDAALAAPGPYLAVDAFGCPGAQRWSQRVTLVPAAFARAARRMLLLRGERKRAVFERALDDGEPRRWPVLAAVHAGRTPLAVYWAP